MENRENDPKTEGFYLSVKRLQSEAGVVGDCSPNLEMASKTAIDFFDAFEHDHTKLTKEDAFFFLSDVHLGRTIRNENEVVFNTYLSHKGCDADLVRMFTKFLTHHPRFINTFSQAIHDAAWQLHNQQNKPKEEGEE